VGLLGRWAAAAALVAMLAGGVADAATVNAAPVKAAAAKSAPAKPAAARSDGMTLGRPSARIEVVEYASLSCPHCARFNAQVFPAFKAKYVDTGKVRYTLREMLTPPTQVAAAGFLLARCAGPERYFKVVDAVFRSQPRWEDGDIRGVLAAIGRENGLSDAQFEACLSDAKQVQALNARVQRAIDAGVESTPTFFVNGRKVAEGEIELKTLDAAIAAARKPAG
jgi:protein-disulfide isomerase